MGPEGAIVRFLKEEAEARAQAAARRWPGFVRTQKPLSNGSPQPEPLAYAARQLAGDDR